MSFPSLKQYREHHIAKQRRLLRALRKEYEDLPLENQQRKRAQDLLWDIGLCKGRLRLLVELVAMESPTYKQSEGNDDGTDTE